MMQYVWTGIAIAGGIAAALFAWRANFSATFVAATIGVAAWFLNYRGRISQDLDADRQEIVKKLNDEDTETEPSVD